MFSPRRPSRDLPPEVVAQKADVSIGPIGQCKHTYHIISLFFIYTYYTFITTVANRVSGYSEEDFCSGFHEFKYVDFSLYLCLIKALFC